MTEALIAGTTDAMPRKFLDTTGLRPSARYFAKGIWSDADRGWVAQYGIPGMFPAKVKDGAEVALYGSEAEAEAAAHRVLVDVLNARGESLNRSGNAVYEPLTPSQLAAGLAEAEVGPSFFAFLVGTRPKRMLGWLSGPTDTDDNRIPHHIRVLLALFARDKANIDLAEAVSEASSSERKPQRDD